MALFKTATRANGLGMTQMTKGPAGTTIRLPDWCARAVAPVVVCAAIWSAYAAGISAPFIMDDASSVTANRSIRSLWPLWPVICYEHGEGRTHDGRPFLNLSLALNRAVTGPSAAGFRAINILIHCGNAILLLALVRILLARPAVPAAIRDRAAAIAFVAALLWAVHPLGTGAVTYVVQRAESLGALMILATATVCVRGIIAADSARGAWALPVVLILSALAGTAKETSVAIPFVTLLVDRALIAGSWRGTLRHWPWHLAAAAAWPSVALMLAALGGRGSSAGLDSASPWLYLLTQAKAIWLYVARIIWPQGLVFDYGDFLSAGLAESGGWLVLTAAVFMAVGYGYARHPVAFLGPLLFFVLLGPTSSVIPVKTQTIAEHRAYLASACLIVSAVAVAVLVALGRLGLSARFCAAAAAAVAVVLGLCTVARNREFVAPEILWRKALAAEPRNERAMINLAAQLIAKKDSASLAEAEELLGRVAETGRFERPMLVNRIALRRMQKRYSEAADDCTEILAITPEAVDIRAERGWLRCHSGESSAGRADLEAAVEAEPDSAIPWRHLAEVLLELGDMPAAVVAAEKAVSLAPASALAWATVGQVRHGLRDLPGSLAAFDRYLSLKPSDASALYNRGLLHAEMQQAPAAIADFTAALAADPAFRDAHYNRGVMLLRAGRTAEARADLEAFMRLGGRPPSAVLALVGLPATPP